MSNTDNPKKRPFKDSKEDDDPVVFKILEGTLKASDYATFVLLVPADIVDDLAAALSTAKNPLFVWAIGDEEITDIQNISSKFAHPIRSIGEIPKDKSESELLDWLIHGESFFSNKYVILKFMRGKYLDYGFYEYVLEIRKKDHLDRVVKALDKIEQWSEKDGEYNFLEHYYVLERGEYLCKFKQCDVVDDDLVEELEQIAINKDADALDDFLCYLYCNSFQCVEPLA